MFGKGDEILDFRLHGQALKDLIPTLGFELIEGGHMLPVTAPTRSPISSGAWTPRGSDDPLSRIDTKGPAH